MNTHTNPPAEQPSPLQPEPCPRCWLRTPNRQACHLCGPGETVPKRSAFPPVDTYRGFVAYLSGGLDCLTHRNYLGKVFWAVFWNCALWIITVFGAAYLIYDLIEGLTNDLPDWLSSISLVAGGLTGLVVTLSAIFYLFPIIFSLFLFPFLDPLSRLAEAEQLGFMPPETSRGFWGDFWDSIDTGARIFVWQILAFILTLPLALTVVGLPFALLLSAFFIGFAWLDYPLTRRGISYKGKWRIAKKNWAAVLGFGLGFQLGLCVPFFGVFIGCPAAAIASARLFYLLELDPDYAPGVSARDLHSMKIRKK